jgi:hypothetical protein
MNLQDDVAELRNEIEDLAKQVETMQDFCSSLVPDPLANEKADVF